ncbi:GDP-L-fucose synthase [uncultured archaeon]|nr:GDP-L-fucose synthase [uncultured archaeon]
MKNLIKNKIVLITGGTGSIGAELVRQTLKFGPKQVRILSRDQTKQLYLEKELNEFIRAESPNVRFFIGDIRDKERLKSIFRGVNIVFHAAALKHVSSCEYNLFEAIKTNVYGLQNVLEEAVANNVERFVYVSTDKAVNPSSIMGLTKYLGEKMVANTYYYQGAKRTPFASVRFGNVLNSSGSIIPLFKQQINQGGPVTITDPNMRRFFMPIPSAAQLVLSALNYSQVNETFILKMPSIKILDLAEVLIQEYAPRVGKDPKDIKIKIIGRYPGEKVHEQLISSEEAESAVEMKDFFIIRPKVLIPSKLGHIPNYIYPKGAGKPKTKSKGYSTAEVTPLTKEQIKKLLFNQNLL